MAEEEEKKDVKVMTDVVTLVVEQQNIPNFYCTMKVDAPLQKLIMSYCKAHGNADYRTLRFTIDGSRVRGHQTARDLCLENGSVIDAWIEYAGGAAAAFTY